MSPGGETVHALYFNMAEWNKERIIQVDCNPNARYAEHWRSLRLVYPAATQFNHKTR